MHHLASSRITLALRGRSPLLPGLIESCEPRLAQPGRSLRPLPPSTLPPSAPLPPSTLEREAPRPSTALPRPAGRAGPVEQRPQWCGTNRENTFRTPQQTDAIFTRVYNHMCTNIAQPRCNDDDDDDDDDDDGATAAHHQLAHPKRTGCRGRGQWGGSSNVGVVALAELARHQVVQQFGHEGLKARQVKGLPSLLTVAVLSDMGACFGWLM